MDGAWGRNSIGGRFCSGPGATGLVVKRSDGGIDGVVVVAGRDGDADVGAGILDWEALCMGVIGWSGRFFAGFGRILSLALIIGASSGMGGSGVTGLSAFASRATASKLVSPCFVGFVFGFLAFAF